MIFLNKAVVVSNEIKKKFKSFLDSGRIFLLCAPCGFGKTTLAHELLKTSKKRVLEVSPYNLDLSDIRAKREWDILFLEDLQLLTETEDRQELCEFIRQNPHKRFVFTTRGAVFGEIIPFRLSGLMTEITENDMFFSKQLTAEFFQKSKVHISESELNSLMNLSLGYPLAVYMTAEKMAEGCGYNQKLSEAVKYEIYKYYDEMIFCRFSLPIRRFLLELAPFESFDMELAKMVSGDSDAGKILAYLQKTSRMLKSDGADIFGFWELFREFLLWEQERYYTAEQQRALLGRGGLYYELHNDYANALKFYSKSGEQNKVSELIIKITALHPGMGYYEELESYFDMLSDETVLKSPALMQGKCMLCSLCGDYEGADKWYNALSEFAKERKSSDAAAQEAKNRLVWLGITLPHRGVTGIADAISKAFLLLTDKKIKLMPFSVTSALPSIMNGGKDFSKWSKKDDLLYATMRIPVEGVLGRDGVGLADCAIAESKFEKGENISDKMLSLVAKLGEIQSKGTPDIEFALVGLLVRYQTDTGRAEDALHTLEALKARFSKDGQTRFIPNIEAMKCRLDLRLGNMDCADEWYRSKAPRNSLKIQVRRRYQYITEAMAELAFGDCDAALLTLSPLETYFVRCERNIDLIHLKTLTAIAKYRKNNKDWKKDIRLALEISEKYGFVRTIGAYGSAVLPLLQELENAGKAGFSAKVIKSARNQAVFYPDFLKPKNTLTEKLTEAEMQVLRLLCADKSNAEIGGILSIQLTTVKSHVSHILQKLGVKRRSEAKTTAERLNII